MKFLSKINAVEIKNLSDISVSYEGHTHSFESILETDDIKLFTSIEKDKLTNIEDNANNYEHPTTPGNKHIPTEGEEEQILRWDSDGTAVWDWESSSLFQLTEDGITPRMNPQFEYLDHVHSLESINETELLKIFTAEERNKLAELNKLFEETAEGIMPCE